MKKLSILFSYLLLSLSLQAQTTPDLIRTTPVPATGAYKNNRATVDANLKASLSFNVPHFAINTLNGAKDSIGYVGFNTTINRFVLYRGGGVWDVYVTVADLNAAVTSFNGRTGAVTLLSADVTTALGYTPVPTTRQLINGVGIMGGGTLATDRTITVDTTSAIVSKANLASQMALKESLSNKQNSLTTDGTGVKYPTVDAVNSSLLNKDSIGYVFVNVASTGKIKIFIPTANTDAARGVALQGAFLFASAKDKISTGSGGYLLTTPIALKDSQYVELNNALIYHTNNTSNIFYLNNVSGVTIHGGTIQGSAPFSGTANTEHGINETGNSSNNRYLDINFRNFKGTGIDGTPTWSGPLQYFTGSTISNCNFQYCYKAMYLVGEYWKVINPTGTHNGIFIDNPGGNLNILGGSASLNDWGYIADGSIFGNAGHGSISGFQNTHNNKGAYYLKNLDIGITITGGTVAGQYPYATTDSTIIIENSKGIKFNGQGMFSPMQIYLKGATPGYNFISYPYFYFGTGGTPAQVFGTSTQKQHLIITGGSSNDSLSTTLNREYGNNKTVLQFLGATTGYQIGQFLGTRSNFIFGINGSSPIGSPTDAPYSSFINTGNKSNLNFGTNQLQTAYIDSLTQAWHFVKDVYLDNALATGISSDVILTKDAATNKLKSIPYNTFQTAITFGTGVQSALGINIGSAGAPVLFNGAGGTPSSIVLTNATGTASALNIGGNAATSTNITAFPLNQSVASTSTPTFSGFTFATSGVQTGRFIDGGTLLSLDTYNGTDFSSRALRLIGNTVTIGSGSSGTAALTISATQNATFSGNLSATTFNSTTTQTTVAGSISGSIVASQPFQGSSYKKVIIYSNLANGTVAYTFPTAFTNAPFIQTATGAFSSVTTTTTGVTATGNGTNGWLVIEGN